jgi:thymidylate synthase (FAD)
MALHDPRFRVDLIAATSNPQQCVYAGMHQDYSEGFVFDGRGEWPDETRAGEIAVKRLLAGERGHYGCYSEDTEVLTSDGWKFWPQVNEQTKLAAYDFNTRKVTYEEPSAVQKWDYSGKMYRLQIQCLNEKYEIFVSPDHRIFYTETVFPDNIKELTAEEFSKVDKEKLFLTFPRGVISLKSDMRVESWEHYDGTIHCATVSTGALVVRRNESKPVVCGNCLEHPAITLNCGWFPHSVLQQARTHRIGCTFDSQSLRYTGQRITDAAEGIKPLEEVFYLRPVGMYTDRKGKKYEYTLSERETDLKICLNSAIRYRELIEKGFAEEHARGILPFDYRQHFVVSFSLRSLMHFLDLRAKLDAQEEIRVLCDLIWPHFESWTPEIAAWYKKNRLHRARLSP